jgi:hypothetical protein
MATPAQFPSQFTSVLLASDTGSADTTLGVPASATDRKSS